MSTPQWLETCRVCTRDVRNDEIDENGICDECMPVLADKIMRLRAENERLKAALEYYADSHAYDYKPHAQETPMLSDRGDVARDALAQCK